MAMTEPVPKEIEDEVKAQLEPLFLAFYSSSKMYKAYYEYIGQFDERYRRATDLLTIIASAKRQGKLNPREETAFDALLYLTQIESLGNAYVDMAIILLSAKGIDFHLEPDDEHRYTRHLSSPKELDSPTASLAVKLDFLKMNGLTFFEKCIDKTLRNRIAHADFEIDDDGTFFQITEKGRKEIDVLGKFLCFRDYVIATERIRRKEVAKVKPPPR